MSQKINTDSSIVTNTPQKEDINNGGNCTRERISIWEHSICSYYQGDIWASLVAQLVKNPPAIRETWVQSLGWEDLLEKGAATHSTILAWRIPWTKGLGRLQSMGSQRVGHNWETFTFRRIYSYFFLIHGENITFYEPFLKTLLEVRNSTSLDLK